MPLRNRPRAYRNDAYTVAKLIAELRRVAKRIRGDFTAAQYRRAGGRVDPSTIRTHFGSWKDALREAGLRHRLGPRAVGAKHSWEECYTNMDRMWRRLGRPPTLGEMDRDPSLVSSRTYYSRFGSWRGALAAFVAYRDGDKSAWPMPGLKPGKPQRATAHGRSSRAMREAKRRAEDGPDKIGMSIRVSVLRRDRFRCSWCTSSPANDFDSRLYVQYIAPLKDGGTRGKDNIACLCLKCSLLLERRREALVLMRAAEGGGPTKGRVDKLYASNV